MSESAAEVGQENLDPEGFLKQMAGWSREVAEELARKNNLPELTDEHWRVIEFVRYYYLKNERGPMVVAIAKDTGMTTRRICDLFPCNIVRGAYRLAGLPWPPGGCA